MPLPTVDSLSALVFNAPIVQCCVPSTAMSVAVSGPATAMSPAYALTRKPSGSSATVSGAGAVTPDLVGMYQLTITVGAAVQTVYIIALPAASFALKGQSGNPINLANLFTTTIGQWSAASFLATVESGGAAALPGGGLVPALFGGSATNVTIPLSQY